MYSRKIPPALEENRPRLKPLRPLFYAILLWAVLISPALAQGEYRQTGDASRSSVDWPGVYQGLLPCADCEGVETTLILRADHSYTLIRRMLGDKIATDEVSGSFTWKADGGTILLEGTGGGPALYKVGENQLWQLSLQGQAIAGPLADSYRLHKVAEMIAPPFEGTRWMLTEVEGGPVSVPKDGKRPYFVLSKDGTVKGFAGCNSFKGKCLIKGEGSFDLTGLTSTMMACPQLETEGKFLKALEEADRYESVGSSLFLYKGNAMLAKLRAAIIRD